MTGFVKDKKTALLLAVFFSTLILTYQSARSQGLETLDREISAIVDHISGGIVTVESRLQGGQGPVFPGQSRPSAQPVNAVVGSGILIDSVGHILTSLGLVDGYDNFRIEIQGQSLNAALVGYDRRQNVAVLKIDSIFHSYIEISSVPPLAGRLALAYGNSIEHTGYPALGIIAGRQSDGSYLVSGTVLPGLLGGGVFDLRGELIGMISSGNVTVNDYRGAWGGIVMIPASVAINSADRIICCGNRDAGYLGISTTAIELVSSGQKILGEAVAISDVEPGSPAAAAGLRVGDIVVRIGAREITNDRELQRLVGSAGADSTIVIELIRGQRRMRIGVTLTSLADGHNYPLPTGPDWQIDRQSMAIDMQRRIDSMRAEMLLLQKQLEHLMGRAGTAR